MTARTWFCFASGTGNRGDPIGAWGGRAGVWCALAVIAASPSASGAEGPAVQPSAPTAIRFAARPARFVRFAILESSAAEPGLDELEVYETDGARNLALSRDGARATASSCLPGYAIHQVAHLNDGLYGNDHSWIAAGMADEWAQIELPETNSVSRVVVSRDRDGRFKDRVPAAYAVQLSLDGRTWETVARRGGPAPPGPDAGWDEFLRYAFLCEQQTWSRIDPADPVARVLRQTEATIARLSARGLDLAAERSDLLRRREDWAQREATADDAAREAAYHDARLAKRRLFLRDPDLAPLRRILFVRRHPYEPSHNYSDILDAHWRPGGGVCVLEIPHRGGRLDPEGGRVTTLFDAKSGVARDAAADFAARTVYFGYREAADAYYRLYAVEADGRGARRLTDGPFHDYYPCPLPDGGLAFISTRCKARFLCWRPQAFVLFRMDADGGGIRALSFANLSEWAPSVMRDGRILWTRSEYLDKGADFGHTLWAIRPDGTHPELVFGNNTPNCYMNGREVPGTREICCTLISHGGDLNGPIGLIDLARGPFDPGAVVNITPDSPPHYNMSWAQRECFRDPVPVSRDLFLCSHAPQRHFGLYVIDRHGNRELIHWDPAIGCMNPTLLRAEPVPPVLAPASAGGDAAEGEFVLEDVYRGLEPHVKAGAVAYLRVCQEVRSELERLPDGSYRNDHEPFLDFYAAPVHLVNGPNGWPSYVAKASLGVVPVERDGSARFRAPAGRVLYFQALDKDLNELQRMRSVVQLQPGERRGCVGCHESRQSAVPSRPPLAMRRPAGPPEAPPWGTGPLSFEDVVQPVLDAHCTRCHGADHPRKINLTGVRGDDRIPASYRTLIGQGLVHYFDMTWGLRHSKAEPMTFGTLRSRLWEVLGAGHHDVTLSRDDMHRVKCWIDLNCPLWPDYLYRPHRPGPHVSRAGDARPGT